MVLDNHTAKIQVGDKVPTLSSKTTSNLTSDTTTSNTVQYQDTGVMLTVTPTTLTGEAIDDTGEVFDRFSIRKGTEPPEFTFVRGDANRSGGVGIGDAIAILNYLLGNERRVCLAACDVNGSGDVSIADPIALLAYLFGTGPAPPAPFPACGFVPGADDTGCVGPCE